MLGNFTFCNPTRLYFGEGSLEHLNEELPKYGETVQLVYGDGSIAYYHYICPYGLEKFVRFAKYVWNVQADGKTNEQLALNVDTVTGGVRSMSVRVSG